MIQAIDPNATQVCYLDTDKREEQPFTIGVIDCMLSAAIGDMFTTYSTNKNGSESAADVKLHIGKKSVETVRYGLKEWSLKDKNGAEVKLEKIEHNVPGIGKREGLTDECLKCLSPAMVRDLADKIYMFSSLTETQEKN